MGNARRYKTCSSCGVNDHFARVWEILMLQYQIADPKFPTRYGRKEYTKTLNGHRRDSRRVASDKIHVQIHLPNHETFTTPTSMSQRSSNMTHPLIMLHIFLGSSSTQHRCFQPGKAILYNPITFHDRLNIHSSQV